ncbi:hypothetical protein BIFBIF_01478 [Bifidobacterium bifidum ATCC 29521 = JCM 1255 = DSM 20456]|nr:hypothetical protein BIFBIF_01478 [Bifidobacterium bifidum ATCC 29521 = JCM 1255 = DSM 20456]
MLIVRYLISSSSRASGTTERINAPNGICNAEPIVDSLVKDKSNGASAFSH